MRIVAEGVEALAAACAGGHLEKVEELVAAGAPPANIDTFSNRFLTSILGRYF